MQRFYILDTRQVAGDCAIWWRAKGAGYTCDLRDAGVFCGELPSLRKTDVLVPVDKAEAAVVMHVPFDAVLRCEENG